MRPDDLVDIRTQDRLRRGLVISLMEAVTAAIEAGLQPDNATKAVRSIWESEERLQQARHAAARTYA